MGNHEKGMKTSPPPPSCFLRKRRLPPALGEAMIVYFEWCGIMTVEQINGTQVCGWWWNFRVIQCKLLILPEESCNTEACSTSLHTSTWQLYCCAKTFDSLLYFKFVKKTLGLNVSQIRKLIWDHCRVSRTSTVMVAWLDCKAIKNSEPLLVVGCLIYTVCIIVCLVCFTHTEPGHFLLYHMLCIFTVSEMIPLAFLLVGEHWESMKADMRNMLSEKIKMSHWQLIPILKLEIDLIAGVYLPLFSLVSSSTAQPPPLPLVVSARITRWSRIRVVHILLSVSLHSLLPVVDRACLA